MWIEYSTWCGEALMTQYTISCNTAPALYMALRKKHGPGIHHARPWLVSFMQHDISVDLRPDSRHLHGWPAACRAGGVLMQRRQVLHLSARVALAGAFTSMFQRAHALPSYTVTAEQMREALAKRFPRRYNAGGLIKNFLQHFLSSMQ